VFIEKTIQLNRIRGAYVIRSTGQLIPFIIGLASMLATVKDISLEWLREKYPNRENVHFRYAGRIATDFLPAHDHHHLADPGNEMTRLSDGDDVQNKPTSGVMVAT